MTKGKPDRSGELSPQAQKALARALLDAGRELNDQPMSEAADRLMRGLSDRKAGNPEAISTRARSVLGQAFLNVGQRNGNAQMAKVGQEILDGLQAKELREGDQSTAGAMSLVWPSETDIRNAARNQAPFPETAHDITHPAATAGGSMGEHSAVWNGSDLQGVERSTGVFRELLAVLGMVAVFLGKVAVIFVGLWLLWRFAPFSEIDDCPTFVSVYC